MTKSGGGLMNLYVILEGGQACENHLRTGGGQKSEIFANVIYEWPQRQIFFSRNRKCKKKLSLCSYLEYASSTFQHLPPTLPCHVHLRHLRNEFLHECQAQRNPRLGLQLRDFRTIHDITIPGKKFFNLITLRTRRTLCSYLQIRGKS